MEPDVMFTPSEIDFGPCFLHLSDISTNTAIVTISNRDQEDIRYRGKEVGMGRKLVYKEGGGREVEA